MIAAESVRDPVAERADPVNIDVDPVAGVEVYLVEASAQLGAPVAIMSPGWRRRRVETNATGLATSWIRSPVWPSCIARSFSVDSIDRLPGSTASAVTTRGPSDVVASIPFAENQSRYSRSPTDSHRWSRAVVSLMIVYPPT